MLQKLLLSVRNYRKYAIEQPLSPRLVAKMRHAANAEQCKKSFTEIMLNSVGLTAEPGVSPCGIYLTPVQRSWKQLMEQKGYVVSVKP